MEKIINVAVSGSELEQSTNFGGIQGEGGARHLKISFDEEWSAYSKSVTFLDANLENPVKVLLTTANMDADGTYLVAIPKTALLTGGKLTYIIEGATEGVLQRSVSKELKVKYAPEIGADDLDGVITPTEADQLNLSIQNEAERIDALFESKADLEESFLSLSESVNKQLLSKADTSYVEAELSKKADASDVAIELSKKCDSSYVENALLNKADKTDVAKELANKANASDVAKELSKKADKTDVAKELSKKCDTSYVAKELLNKADIIYVDEEVSKKADSAYVRDELSKKADSSYVAEEISKKADSAYVTEEIAKKADQSFVEEEISALDIRLSQQEDYIAEKTDEMFERNDIVANAVIGRLEGNIVCARDVSPIGHNLDIKVKSDNIVPITYDWAEKDINGTTLKVNEDKSITVSGVPSANASLKLCQFDASPYMGKSLVIPASQDVIFYVHLYYKDGTVTYNWLRSNTSSLTKTVPHNAQSIDFGIGVLTTFDGSEKKAYPQINVGTVAKNYSPYVSPNGVSVSRYGKNLIPYPFGSTTKEENGVTITDNGDGSVTVSGTPTVNTSFNLLNANKKRIFMPKGYSFRLSGGAEAKNTSEFYTFVSYDEDGTVTTKYDNGTTGGITFAPTENAYLHSAGIVLKAGNTFDNVTFKPILELGDTTTEFEMYKGEEKFVTEADGSLALKSASPSMTLVCDKAGVSVELCYNKDTNKVIESLINAIISLGGNI